ncbi:MAG: hypothetical protein KAX38_01635, partial [Candidatus Krumholzibacteria bacterium]|nr:hypothetical protein [Candidatus Krumholzibacteria bacterium]
MPEPERAEEIIHIPLLVHEEPRNLLLIGGSLGGGWEEAVKHPSLERIDCLELDGELLKLALEMECPGDSVGHGMGLHHDGEGPEEMGVGFIVGDGRFFLSSSRTNYDVVVVNAPPPINLQWNRYYTVEFFELVRRSLRPGGIFAFSHPSSENFLSPAQARIIRSLERTLDQVFQETVVLPGSTTHFLASEQELDVDAILTRLKDRGIKTRFINEDFLPFRFSAARIDFLSSSLEGAGAVNVNTDVRPLLLLYELLLEGERERSSLMRGFERLLDVSSVLPPGILAVVLIVVFLSAGGGRAARVSVLSVGLAGFLFQFLVLLVYQSFSGLLYYAIVLLTALFMAGASLGAWSSLRSGKCRALDLRLIHLCFALLSLALVGWMYLLRAYGFPYAIGTSVFLIFSAGGGFLTGSYYPVVVRTALPDNGSVVPATFYAWDMFGA